MAETLHRSPEIDFDTALKAAWLIALEGILKFNRASPGMERIIPLNLVHASIAQSKIDLDDSRGVYTDMVSSGLAPAVVCYPEDLTRSRWNGLVQGQNYNDPAKEKGFAVSEGVDEPEGSGLFRSERVLPQGWATAIISTSTERRDLVSEKLMPAGVEVYTALQWQRLVSGDMPLDVETTALLKHNGRDLFGYWDGYKARLKFAVVQPADEIGDDVVIPRFSSVIPTSIPTIKR